MLYVLALGSPTHPLDGRLLRGWTATYQWENLYGHDFLYAGPLFMHQFSHAWIDFRGIRDRFMREKRCDYFENSRRAPSSARVRAAQPARVRRLRRGLLGIHRLRRPERRDAGRRPERRQLVRLCRARRAVRTGRRHARAAGRALASLPFAPEIALCAARAMHRALSGDASPSIGYASSFNPSVADADGRAWVSAGHFGLDQGIVVMMIENHRTELIWRLMRELSLYRRRSAPRRIQRRLAVAAPAFDGRRRCSRAATSPSALAAGSRTSASAWTTCVRRLAQSTAAQTGTTWSSSAPARRGWSRRTPRRHSARKSR